LPGFGVSTSPERSEEVGLFRRLAPVIVLRTFAPTIGFLAIVLSAMIAPPAIAQTNIDQGKSPAELFANDCAACHKTTRGLANGENSLSLSVFLREHYTASRDQAAALAAYVLANGGNAPAPKPTVERAKGQEPKGQEQKGQEVRGQEPRGQEPKSQEAKGQELKGQEPKSQESRGQESKGQEPKNQESKETKPPEPKVEEARTPPPTAQPEPASTGATPTASEGLSGPTTSAATPGESEPSDNAPVPRDNIPD
jgi:mono/diheme cytochrome c family protein